MRAMRSLRFVVGLSAFLLPVLAHADWPTWRHDAKRTAIAPGTSTINAPTKYWQYYMGGSLRSNTHLALDVDKDGTVDVLYLAGGKAIAKLPDDRLVWESPPVELSSLHGVVDLDGDGTLEVIASSSRNVFVLSGVDGKILWKEPDGEVGNVGGVRLGDLDGDGKPDLVIDDCACCGISATASVPGGVYKFGTVAAPTKLYAPLTRTHCGSDAVTLLDADGDGKMEVAYANNSGVVLTKGSDGSTLGSIDLGAENLYYSSCEPANVDGRPGDELICFQNTYLAAPNTGGRRVAVLTWEAGALKALWNVAPVPKATGALTRFGNSVLDLDGDGSLEITVGWSSDGASWTTQVYDAKTGASLGTVGEKLAGIVDVDGDKKPELATESGTGLMFRKFVRGGAPALTSFALLPGARVAYQYDLKKSQLGTNGSAPLTVDLKGDGKVLPIFFFPATSTDKAKYVAEKFDSIGTPTAVATHEVPDGVSMLTAQVFGKVNRAYPQLMVTRNDGYLLVLDDAFAATNGITYGTGEFKVTLPGMRVGGFVAAPIAPRLDGTTDAVVGTDSRGTLIRLDASAAWMALAPKVQWEQRDASSPTTVKGIDGTKPGIVCSRRTALSPNSVLSALSATGTKLWDRSLAGSMLNDALGGDVNGDGAHDVFTAYLTGGAVVNLQVHDGKTGAPLWSAPHTQALDWGWQPFSVADYDGNGVADLFAVPNTLRVLSGNNGTKLAENTTFLAYFTPTIDDVDGDGVADVTLSRGYYPARTLKKDLTTQLWIGGDDRPYQSGARAACPGGRSVWVQPSLQYPGVVRLTTMNGTVTTTSIYLAGGAKFATAADAATAGKFLGTLGDVAVKTDLLGSGAHPEALVGSTDGYLYALDPCSAALDWAYDLRFAVGDPIFADTSGDGVDEILVPAADGYVHALGQRVLVAPTEVNDNDPFGAIPAADIDEVATFDRLAASWGAVAGAEGYQVSVTTEGGTFVTQPDWVDVGAVTSTTLKGLSLATGKKYFVAVRAIAKGKGSSLETRSDGVVVKAPPATDGGLGDVSLGEDTGAPELDTGVSDASPDAPAPAPSSDDSGGCGCRTTRTHGEGLGLFAIGFALLVTRRRRA